MKCPFKFNNYDFEGGQDCIGSECGMHKLCANDTLAAENDVSKATVDANDESELQDSREKLEADARVLQTRIWKAGADNDGISLSHIIELLDRQAAITERDLCRQCCWPSLAAQPDQEAYDRIAELQAKVDELTAELERETLTACNTCAARLDLEQKVDELTEDYKASSNGLEILTLKNAELQTQVNKIKKANDDYRKEWHRVCAERVVLQASVDDLTDELEASHNAHAQAEHEAATLRDKLGRMLDNAHEISRIGGDE